MRVIDAHQHFWHYHPGTHGWINDEMSAIRRDFLPAHLERVLDENNVEGCIAVQADQTEKETGFLLQLADENNFIKAVVGWVDLRADDLYDRLVHYKQKQKLKGFRHILQGEPPSFMLQADFLRGIALLKDFDFTYDILVYPHHLGAALALVKQNPGQNFVIDHLAKPYIKDKKIDEWKRDIQAIAVYPNVYCKISGMVTEADWKNWRKEDLYPYLDAVTEAFGTKRLMFGSDWPVCLVAASYQKMMEPVIAYYESFSGTEKEDLFYNNATSFYHL